MDWSFVHMHKKKREARSAPLVGRTKITQLYQRICSQRYPNRLRLRL